MAAVFEMHKRGALAAAVALALGAFGAPAFADEASPARVTPVDTSGGQIRTTALPGAASSGDVASATGVAAGAVNAPSASGARGTASSMPAPANTTPGQVVVGGKVPDEATHSAVLQRLRDTYGAANVVDQIEVGDVATPPNWSANVQKLINPQLKQVHKGQLKIDGTQIEVRGEVGNEAQRQQIASDMANALNPTYTIRNGLRVSASEQGLLDQTLANRTIEFETGSATLAPQGRAILDQMAAVLAKMNTRTVEIIGHTDNSGNRASNIALSQARADTVKGYLVGKGISPQQLTTDGVGPDQPVASNDTAEGRARNRRIEFRAGL
ncbi:Peptidoglycan-associated lipoprotein [Paraburkholderia caffeinitolerans]|uniref:Peptidoglycan-associated lipoprotein n=1 Tax=Paraburkholderia caffeinitolerans TaxID=1723730 RepID=A0A6J5G6J0_9BURK|nr:OmpA family protein [Paraburkholderia caffeinitolerans]CAB3792654.1 Peptidoglycan-associated lipoprotein [Paraburkholderia caffeinitolerans]